jgi:hypothetical protein
MLFGETISHVEKRKDIDDILEVGVSKSIGYAPLDRIARAGYQLQTLRQEFKLRGIDTILIEPSDDTGYGHFINGALYVYDKRMLQELLDKKREIVEMSGWPIDAEEFVDRVIQHIAPGQTPIYDVISDAFASYDDEGRLNRKK